MIDNKQHHIDTLMISTGAKSMGGGTITTVIGYLSSSGFAVLIGIIVTILGFAFSMYFQNRQNTRNREKWEMEKNQIINEEKRKEEIHELMLKDMRSKLKK